MTLKTQTATLVLHDPVYNPDQVRANLIMVMESMGLAPTFDNFTDLAGQLSKLAGQNPPWSAKYIHSVYKGYKGCQASPALGRAVMAMGELVDSTPPGVAGGEYVRVLAYPGQVPEGTVIPRAAQVVRCQRPGCPVLFIRTHPSQRFHDPSCQRLWAKEKRKREVQ